MNGRQKDGIAGVSDNIALGSMFGGIGGWFTDTFKWYIGVGLLFVAIAAFVIAYKLRKDGGNNAS